MGGASSGTAVGAGVADGVGLNVGAAVGCRVGKTVGIAELNADTFVGTKVGNADGEPVKSLQRHFTSVLSLELHPYVTLPPGLKTSVRPSHQDCKKHPRGQLSDAPRSFAVIFSSPRSFAAKEHSDVEVM